MKLFNINCELPAGCYAKQVTYDNEKSLLNLLLAFDLDFFGERPAVSIQLNGSLMPAQLIGVAPSFFVGIPSEKLRSDARVTDCVRYSVSMEQVSLETQDSLELFLVGSANTSKTRFDVREFYDEISDIETQLLALIDLKSASKRNPVVRPILRSLKAMPKAWRNNPKHSELYAYALGAISAKPAYTTNLIQKIRKQYNSTKSPEQFEQFQINFDKLIHPKTLYPHGYSSDNPLHAHEPKFVANMIKELFDKFKTMGYDCFINSGSLLGLVREGGFIAHDDDIDVGAIMKSKDLLGVTKEWVNFRDNLYGMGLIDLKNQKSNALVIKIKNELGISFDLFTAWFDKDDEFSIFPHSRKNLERADIYPLRKDTNFGILMPQKPEKMLESNFGPNWATPDPLWRFNWTKSNHLFKSYGKSLALELDRVVITYGAFDNLTEAQSTALEKTAQLGSRLVVSCTSDELAKKQEIELNCSFESRRQALLALPFVDAVIPEKDPEHRKQDVKALGVSVIANVEGDFKALEPLRGLSELVNVE